MAQISLRIEDDVKMGVYLHKTSVYAGLQHFKEPFDNKSACARKIVDKEIIYQ